MNKQQLIDLLVVRGVATREQLQSKLFQQLEDALDQSNLALIRANAQADPEVIMVEAEAAQAKNEAWQTTVISRSAERDEELEELAEEDAEERQDWLVQASPDQLRAAARGEAEQTRQQFQRTEQEGQLAGQDEKDAAYGYVPLP